MKVAVVAIVPLVALVAMSDAAPAGEPVAWPCFHGPRRDNKSIETGLAKTWPEGGPALIWTASGIGHGYSSVAVAGGRVFTAGMIDKKTHVIALDLAGKVLWRRGNGESWQASQDQRWAVPYDGSRSTPTIGGDTVYHLSELGRLAAFAAETGDERWHVNIVDAFEAERPKYGFSESVLIDDNRLFCCPGGKKGYVVALDKATGRMLWANKDIADPVGYASPVIAEIGGVRQLINVSARHIFAVRVDDGRLLWRYAFGNPRDNNATDVIVSEGLVYGSSGYGKGSVLLRPQRGEDGRFTVELVWSSRLLDNHHGGVLFHDGRLYGAGHEAKGWFCLDFKTGEKLWEAPGKGALTYADERLYCFDEKGTMFLVRATPEKWDVAGTFAVPSGGRGLYWAHPVVCGGRLYVRHSEKLYAYRLREQAEGAEAPTE